MAQDLKGHARIKSTERQIASEEGSWGGRESFKYLPQHFGVTLEGTYSVGLWS